MKLHVVTSALFTLFSALAAAGIKEKLGLGISLSSGYGTASARFSNGTYLDLAKIEGGTAYKQYMLGSSRASTADDIVTPKYCPFTVSVCRHWPMKETKQAEGPLTPMLRALVTAAAAALERKIDSAAVGVSDFRTVDHETARSDVKEALDALGIHGRCSDPFVSPDDPAYHDDPAQSILVVEHTRHSMTAGYWEEECGVLSRSEGFRRPDLGQDALDLCKMVADGSAACDPDEAVKSALNGLIPVERSGDEKLGAVLVMGDQAHNEAMKAVLRQVLTGRSLDGEKLDMTRVRDLAPDEAFAGSRAAALAEWGTKTGCEMGAGANECCYHHHHRSTSPHRGTEPLGYSLSAILRQVQAKLGR